MINASTNIQLQLNHGKLNSNSSQYHHNLTTLTDNQHAETILAGWNQNSQIIMLFTKLGLSRLQVLTLSGNKLQSIESIHKIWMPCLEKLQMIDNNIQSVKSIRKSYWPCLQQIHFGSTNIFPIEMDGFQELHTVNLRSIFGGLTNPTVTKLLKSNFRLQLLIIEAELPKYFSDKFPTINNQLEL